ncbi:MAG: SEC-C domain-containing protein [Syntrophomonadaceae bacterium]|jgi:predicted aspartyl protease|nr:SEC-C domain-containing protein [Syntrophomonadaceae bacterium]
MLCGPIGVQAVSHDDTPIYEYQAIWDTGATSTVITPKVVKDLGLRVVSVIKAHTPSGEMDCDQFYVNLFLPNHVEIKRVRVTQAVPHNCDVLVGMDIIGMGDFAVSNYNGKTMFSFRIPSLGSIDFVKNTYKTPLRVLQKQERNALCACGSGKKFKHCCGRN